LKFTAPVRLFQVMRIADVCAFYTPAGGGVRTYVEAKLRAAARFGHEIVVIAPGERHQIIKRGPGAVLVTIPSPRLPVDRRYRYFDDERALHSVLDAWRPDHVEASSPWSSATMVGRWQGAASRSLVMHSDPLAAYAYRWLGGFLPTHRIDGLFGWFWRHLRGLGRLFDTVICANGQLAERLREGGVANTETLRMGVEAGLFSPSLRSPLLREEALSALGLDAGATLLVGIGRFSAEKRWDMVMRAVGEASRRRDVGLLLVGDGSKRGKLELLAERIDRVAVLPRIGDRDAVDRRHSASRPRQGGGCRPARTGRRYHVPGGLRDFPRASDRTFHRARPGTPTRRRRAIEPRTYDGRAFLRSVPALRGAGAAARHPDGRAT
jgi:alpha-1,6-mannosyltransferase